MEVAINQSPDDFFQENASPFYHRPENSRQTRIAHLLLTTFQNRKVIIANSKAQKQSKQ